MRAVRYHRHGGPEVLQVEERPIPEPVAGQVQLRVEAVGANAIDSVLRAGTSPWPRPLPAALTGDVTGRITALGPDAPVGLAVGQRVAGVSEDAFAEYAVIDARFLATVPDDADAGAATMLAMTAPLAWRALKLGRVGPGDTVLIQSAAGTVGHLAVQLAHRLGASTVIGTASSEHRLDFIRSLGAQPVDHTRPDWPDQIRKVAPDGVHVVLDAVGGTVFDQGLELLRPLGRMVTYGAIGGELPTVPAQSLFQLKTVTGLSMLAWRSAAPEQARTDITDVSTAWTAGELRPIVAERFDLAEVAHLHHTLDQRTALGRLIARP